MNEGEVAGEGVGGGEGDDASARVHQVPRDAFGEAQGAVHEGSGGRVGVAAATGGAHEGAELAGGAGTEHWEQKKYDLDEKKYRLDRIGTIISGIGFLAVVIALIFNYLGLQSSRQAIEASNRQLRETQFESVYGHQLELWKIAAENKDVARYVVGGERPPNPLDPTVRAALYEALDFYNYVWDNMQPTDTD